MLKVKPGEVLKLVYRCSKYYFRKPDGEAPFGWHEVDEIEFVEDET